MRALIAKAALKKTFSNFDYLLFFLLIQIGWFSILFNIRRLELVVLVIVFYTFYKRNRQTFFDSKIVIIFIIFALLAFVQGVIWGFSIVSFITSFLVGFLLPYYLLRVYKDDFFILLEKVIYVLTLISLIIWLAHQFIPGVKEVISGIIIALNKNNTTQVARGMIFYTYWPKLDQDFGLTRNAGFRSEPGAFAVFLILAIVINYQRKVHLFDKRNILYYLALLSTFSTAGYLALAALGLLFIKQKNVRIIGVLLFPIIAYGASYAYGSLDFMKDKIDQQYEQQTEVSLNEPTSGRFLGARKSLVVLSRYPLFGRGLLARTKPETMSDPEYAEYGFLSEVSRFGIVFGGLLLYFFIRGVFFYIKSGGYGIYEFLVCSIALMINLSSQAYLTSPFFMIFFYMGMYKYVSRNQNQQFLRSKQNSLLPV